MTLEQQILQYILSQGVFPNTPIPPSAPPKQINSPAKALPPEIAEQMIRPISVDDIPPRMEKMPMLKPIHSGYAINPYPPSDNIGALKLALMQKRNKWGG